MARRTGSQGEATEARIHAAAERLFAARGYAAVSMRQIAAEVGVQVGTIYLYVPDKQTLLSRMMVRHMEAVLANWRKVDPGAQVEAMSRLEAFVRFHVGYHIDLPEAVFIAYMELRSLEEDGLAQVTELRRAYEAELETILVAGEAEGVWTLSDGRVACMGIIAMLTGVTTWFRAGGRLGKPEVEAHYWALVRGMVLAKGLAQAAE